MKVRIIQLGFTLCMLLVMQTLALAQNNKKWNVGVTGGLGRDFFYRKYHGPRNEIPPGAIRFFNSLNSLKAGLSVERFIRPRLAIKSQLECSFLEMPNKVMFEISSIAWYPKNEKHYWGSFSIGARGYLKSAGPFKVFADIGVQGDYFLGLKRYPEGQLRRSYWEAEDYFPFVPSAYGGIGVRWKRFALAADYQFNIARTFAIDNPKIYNNPKHLKRSISRQGVSLKATFLLIKAGEQWY